MTDYVKVENGKVVWGPSNLPKSYTFADGRTTGDFDLLGAATIKGEGFKPLISNIPDFDSRYQTATMDTPIVTADSVTYNWTVSDIPAALIKGSKKSDVNQVMQGKLYNSKMSINGHDFTMTQNTMLVVNNMATIAKSDPTWNGVLQDDMGDFVALSASDVIALSDWGQNRLANLMSQASVQVTNINALVSSKDVAEYNISIS